MYLSLATTGVYHIPFSWGSRGLSHHQSPPTQRVASGEKASSLTAARETSLDEVAGVAVFVIPKNSLAYHSRRHVDEVGPSKVLNKNLIDRRDECVLRATARALVQAGC